MTTILQPAARKLIGGARLSTRRSTSRTPFLQLRAALSTPEIPAWSAQLRRCYSSEPPGKADKQRKAEAAKFNKQRKPEAGKADKQRKPEAGGADKAPDSKGNEVWPPTTPPPLEGWVWPTEEEIKKLCDTIRKVPGDFEEVANMMEMNMKKIGIPRALQVKPEGLVKTVKYHVGWTKMLWEFSRLEVKAQKEAEEKAREQSGEVKAKADGKEEKDVNKSTPDLTSNQPSETQDGQQDGQQVPQPGQGPQPEGQPGGNDPNNKKKDGKKGDSSSFSASDFWGWVIGSIVLYPVYQMLPGMGSSREITWQELRKNFLDKGLVTKIVVVGGKKATIELNREAMQAMYPDSVTGGMKGYWFSIGSVEAFERQLEDAQNELGIPPADRIPVQYSSDGIGWQLLMAFGPTLMLVGLLLWGSRAAMSRGGGSNNPFNMGRSNAKMFNQETAVKVKFADVAGMDEAKVEIMEFVSFLKTPERFRRLGAKIPRGAILSGPPGTGKTLLAKATAGESGVPFFSVSGSEFVEMFVGVGASRVRDLFTRARKNAPCIIFIDEIDAIGRSRSEGTGRFSGNDEREATLNQILTEMDGFNTLEQVVVLAGTNRPDVLDQALMRPGRFDRHIHIDRPTTQGRQDIFKVHMQKILTNEDIDFLTGRLAALTPGFAGADIANVVNEAALIAARGNAATVQMTHFEQAIERVVGGLERKSMVLSPEEKRTVAYHEAGHAICGWFFKWADPLLKVSIIPRGQAAGYAQYLPAGDTYLMSTQQLMDRMAMALGGRVSEELHFESVTTGASDDFKKVTSMASLMVTQWGMSEKLGPLHFVDDPKGQFSKPFAESTAQTIDAEVRRLVDLAYVQCKDLLTARKKEVGLVAEELLRKEVLDREDMERLIGPRPFPDKAEFLKFFGKRDASASGTTPVVPPVVPPLDDTPKEPEPPTSV